MTIKDAIKKFVKSLTGSDVEGKTIAQTLENASEATGETGGMLPAVAAADEGKVLMVNASGEWVVASIPSQLPAVTSDDNGKVLKVAEGVWGVGTDATE